MKLFSDYINEEYSSKILRDIRAVYKFPEFRFKLNVPETYEESDIQQYLDDYLLDKLPNDPEIGKKAFGVNYKFMADAFFEYSRYDVLTKKLDDVDLEWNEDFSNESIDDEQRIITVILYNFKYIIEFDKFQIKYNKDPKKALNDLFKAYEYNDQNDYPVKLMYDDKALEFVDY